MLTFRNDSHCTRLTCFLPASTDSGRRVSSNRGESHHIRVCRLLLLEGANTARRTQAPTYKNNKNKTATTQKDRRSYRQSSAHFHGKTAKQSSSADKELQPCSRPNQALALQPEGLDVTSPQAAGPAAFTSLNKPACANHGTRHQYRHSPIYTSVSATTAAAASLGHQRFFPQNHNHRPHTTPLTTSIHTTASIRMATDTPKQITLTTSDSVDMTVDREVAERSILIKNLLEDLGESSEAIPIPNVRLAQPSRDSRGVTNHAAGQRGRDEESPRVVRPPPQGPPRQPG
jgi:hypothetical protein